MRRVFIDTGAFVALRNRSEREHRAARTAFATLVRDRVPLITSNLVFSETYTALLVRVGYTEAIAWGRGFRSTTAIELIRVDEAMEDATWSLLERHNDKRWSYVDASSFVVMEQLGIREAFTFDAHFAQRGLTTIPAVR